MAYMPETLRLVIGSYPDDDEDGNDLEDICGMYLDVKAPNQEWTDRVLFIPYPEEEFHYQPPTDGQYSFRARVSVWMSGAGSTQIVGPPGPVTNKSVRVSAPKAPGAPTIIETPLPLVQTDT